MQRRQLPPQLKSLAVAAGLAAAAALAAAGQVTVTAPPEPPLQQVSARLPAGAHAELELDVGGDGSGRLVFGTLRSDAVLATLALVDPAGREVWRRTPAELGLVPRAQTPQPALGDALVLPEVSRPRPGRWLLRVERAGTAHAAARLQLSYRLLPRHMLVFARDAVAPAAGQPLLLTLRPSDMGRPVHVPAALALQVQPLQPGLAVQALQARQDLAGPTGVRISTEPGTYLVQWRPAAAGSYEIRASWQPPGAAAPLVAVQRIDIAAAAAQLRFTGARAEAAAGCVRELVLGFSVQLDAPPPAGAVHSLAARLRGVAQLQQVSASVPLTGRGDAVELRVSRETLRALGWPLQRIESTQLMRFSPEFKPLLAGDVVDLSALLPDLPLCP